MVDLAGLYWWGPVVAAPFIGSFLGVVTRRLPDSEPVVAGRSRCPHCRRSLQPLDLVPMLSWLALRGRCRHCAKPISIFYPLVELAALGVALWAATVMSGWVLLATCALGWMLLALAVIDWRHFLLPDVLTLPLAVAGFAAAWAFDGQGLDDHLGGTAAGYGFAVCLAWAYRRFRGRDGMGQGDAKLLAAAGAWVGWQGLPSVVFIAAVSGLLVALLKSLLGEPLSATQRVPFGTYLCAGLWLVWLYGPLIPG